MRRTRWRYQGKHAPDGSLKLFVVIFGGIGLLLLLIAGGFVVWTKSWLNSTVAAEGRVIELVGGSSGPGRRGGSYHPVVAFTAQDGRKFEFRSSTGSDPPAFRVGEIVTVRYRPDDPRSAGIDAFFSLYLMPLIFGFIGAIFTLVGGGIAFASRLARKSV